MKNEAALPKYYPKGEVLRKVAERYPEVDPEAMEIILSIKRIASDEECSIQQVLEPYGVSEGRFYVLCHLFSEELVERREPSPSEIAESIGVTRATVTGLLDGLERDGFLQRRHDSTDRRALTIHMTEKGRSLLERFIPKQCCQINSQMSQLSANEKRTLIALLAKIEAPKL